MRSTLILIALFLLFLASCTSVKQIGALNMISNRNIDRSLNYKPLLNYAGGSKRELKKSRCTSLQEAVDKTVKKVPNGEFLMNVKLYLIKGKYFAVEGDVWGN